MQNFDSEFCYVLIEFYVSFYEVIGNIEWLKMGEDIVWQFVIWVIVYDYFFLENFLFGREGMYFMGVVNVNI